MPEEGTCDIRLTEGDGTRDILCLSGVLLTEEGNVRLDMARGRDRAIYEERQGRQRVCQGVFLLTVIICAVRVVQYGSEY